VLLHIAQLRSAIGRASPREIEDLFIDLVITAPANVSNVLASLENAGLAARGRGRGSVWGISPRGRQTLTGIIGSDEISDLFAEVWRVGASLLGGAVHPIFPPELSPPQLVAPLRAFMELHPFDRNVFGMTRYADGDPGDPVIGAINVARDACRDHGVEFHLASDRAIVDDLWANVAAHMWASKYGIAFFEDRRAEGLSYNLTIEVGAMLMAGRRCALLKDVSIARMPTDLVGQIYKAIDLDDGASVKVALHAWLRDDLAAGSCARCPAA
jgi:hypothetical protein